MRASVDLPAPFGPMRAILSPRSMASGPASRKTSTTALLALVGLREGGELEDGAAGARGLGEAEADGTVLRGRRGEPLELLEPLDPALRLAAFVALARNRAMNRSASAISRCWLS
jgi:hypothetical protein